MIWRSFSERSEKPGTFRSSHWIEFIKFILDYVEICPLHNPYADGVSTFFVLILKYGKSACLLFSQFLPIHLPFGRRWHDVPRECNMQLFSQQYQNVAISKMRISCICLLTSCITKTICMPINLTIPNTSCRIPKTIGMSVQSVITH